MGNRLLDQYSLLHFASGVIAYFLGLEFKTWSILHIIFEIVENSPMGISFINNYLTFWPGGKPESDAIVNQFGDTIAALLGWACAYWLDLLGKKYNWYNTS